MWRLIKFWLLQDKVNHLNLPGNVLENLIIMFLLEDFFSVDDIPEEEWEQLSQSEYDSDYLPSHNDSMQDSEEV